MRHGACKIWSCSWGTPVFTVPQINAAEVDHCPQAKVTHRTTCAWCQNALQCAQVVPRLVLAVLAPSIDFGTTSVIVHGVHNKPVACICCPIWCQWWLAYGICQRPQERTARGLGGQIRGRFWSNRWQTRLPASTRTGATHAHHTHARAIHTCTDDTHMHIVTDTELVHAGLMSKCDKWKRHGWVRLHGMTWGWRKYVREGKIGLSRS